MERMTKQTGIKIYCYKGTWGVIGTHAANGRYYYLLENEQFGEDVAMLIVNDKFKVILDDVYDGFNDLREYLEI